MARNTKLIEARNKQIFVRFDHWHNKKNRRVEWVMHHLMWKEFYLSERMLWEIIRNEAKRRATKAKQELLFTDDQLQSTL